MSNRSMLALPTLVQPAGLWRLPLCDVTAMVLATALVDAPANRVAPLAEALALDPGFAIWACCKCFRFGPNAALTVHPSLPAIADWLSPRLADLLHWSAAYTIELTSEQHGRFAALVAESVGAAQAVTSAISNDDPNHTSVYLRALLARWDNWFDAARTGEVSAEITPPQNPFTDASSPAAERSNSGTVSDEAWRRWLTEIPGVQTLLPALAAQHRSMAEMNTHFEARLHSAKMDSLKEFAYGAGHELNNPLANIASRAQMLLREETNPERRRRLAAINTQAFRAHEMLADLMLFARPPQLKPEPVDLVQLVDDVFRELEAESAASEIALHHPTRRDPLVIEADPVQLQIALRALCVNSMEAIGKQGNVTFELCVSDADPRGRHSGDVVQIVISDDGPGIAPELHSKIFDPFYSGREAGRGLGFGLSKCWRIVTLHGGWIDVSSQPGQGTTFTLGLPVRKPTIEASFLSVAQGQT